MRIWLALGLLAVSTSAQTQPITVTDCSRLPALCVNQPDIAGSFIRGQQAGAALRAQQNANRAAEADYLAQKAAEAERAAAFSLRQIAGKLIADGHCDKAKELALQNGALDLAAQVATLCATP